jgi:hypothetical protein
LLRVRHDGVLPYLRADYDTCPLTGVPGLSRFARGFCYWHEADQRDGAVVGLFVRDDSKQDHKNNLPIAMEL